MNKLYCDRCKKPVFLLEKIKVSWGADYEVCYVCRAAIRKFIEYPQRREYTGWDEWVEEKY